MNLIAFHWQRCPDGYRIDGRDATEASPAVTSITTGRRRTASVITGDSPGAYIAPNSSRREHTTPLTQEPALFAALAATPETPEGVLAFTNRFGLLGGFYLGSRAPQKMYIDEAYRYIQTFRKLIGLWNAEDFVAIADYYNTANMIGACNTRLLYPAPEGHPVFQIDPRSLIAAIYLQFALAVSAGQSLQVCTHCSQPFLYGPGTGRRRSAQYCSDRCRAAYHWNRKQKETPK